MSVVKEVSTKVEIFKNRKAMGQAAGRKAEEYIVKCLERKKEVRVIFAAAPSQNEKLEYLASSKIIDWKRVTAFHMDEYIGLSGDSPQSFGYFLRKKIFEKVPLGKIHYMQGTADEAEECKRYAALLTKAPIDVLLCGIGENGHLAFNDPPVANFQDPEVVKTVLLEKACRTQQVSDGCFPSLDKVPKRALTMTIPIMMSATYAVCTVPGPTKTQAVERTLKGPISVKCPASILRLHRECHFFLDPESGKELLC